MERSRAAGAARHGRDDRPRPADARDQLTAQELQIAQLAAQGLSNREIGERLFLSHRTIGSHLYRIFPKLGITSRSQLRDALAPPAASENQSVDSIRSRDSESRPVDVRGHGSRLLAASSRKTEKSNMSELPNIVLVHGAWADGSSWSAVIESLQAGGYDVTAPQFPETSLADDVARLRQSLPDKPVRRSSPAIPTAGRS